MVRFRVRIRVKVRVWIDFPCLRGVRNKRFFLLFLSLPLSLSLYLSLSPSMSVSISVSVSPSSLFLSRFSLTHLISLSPSLSLLVFCSPSLPCLLFACREVRVIFPEPPFKYFNSITVFACTQRNTMHVCIRIRFNFSANLFTYLFYGKIKDLAFVTLQLHQQSC